MDVQHKLVTLAEFEAFIQLPENADRIFELIAGEIVEKMLSNLLSSNLATQIIMPLGIYLATNDIGHITGDAGGYKFFGHIFVPDVGFILKKPSPATVLRRFCAHAA